MVGWSMVPFERSLHSETRTPPELASCAERVVLVRLSGEVDGAESDRFAASLTAYADGGPADLILDLSRVTFLSAAGADVLVAFSEEFSRIGRRLLLVVGSGQARRLLDVLRVAEGLEIHASVDLAVSAYLNSAESVGGCVRRTAGGRGHRADAGSYEGARPADRRVAGGPDGHRCA
jgi:anti-sigma B factor antagonist